MSFDGRLGNLLFEENEPLPGLRERQADFLLMLLLSLGMELKALCILDTELHTYSGPEKQL